jgi:ribosomal-protein-alanine N-acetyltransferase
MLKINFNPFPLITTERLVLRKVEKGDVNEILFLRSDEKVMKYLDRAPAKSLDDAFGFILKITGQEADNESVTWAINLKGNSKLIGTICYWNIQKEHHRAEVGYVLHPEYWGKGIMQESLTEVLKYGFEVMKLHSVEANVNPENIASIKLLEKNNFKREAYFRENYFYNGKFLDSTIYSLLAIELKKE